MPSFTFDGTDFTISSAQTEIKTYQQLWAVRLGAGGVTYNTGRMRATGDGSNKSISVQKTLSETIDLSDMTDFTINIKTTGADASWTLQIFVSDSASITNSHVYSKVLANDVDATYTLSDFAKTTYGSEPDTTAITYFSISGNEIDTAVGGGVLLEIKDFKYTTPVKTSDLYDSTGQFVLHSEDYEGDDGLAIDSYDTNVTVTGGAGASVAEIDDAQSVGGSTSLLIYRDGANNVIADHSISAIVSDRMRFIFNMRAAQTNARGYFVFRGGGNDKQIFYMQTDGTIRDGAVVQYGTYVADTWYEMWVDIDITADKTCLWQDGVMLTDWINMTGAAVSIDEIRFSSNSGTGSFWFDDVKAYPGFEDFAALTAPHDVNDICEAVSPSGTDYGRGTWDGDWGVGFSVDNTDVVIGTNSIKYANMPNSSYRNYDQDTTFDLTNYTHLRGYVKCASACDIQIKLVDDDGSNSNVHSVTVPAGKWTYFDVAMAYGVMDPTIFYRFKYRQTSGGVADTWIDGLHFYGDEAAGVEWKGNSLDIDANTCDQDSIEYFNIKEILDTTGGGSFTSDAGIEFTDVANAGTGGATPPDITIEGTAGSHVLWTSEGHVDPTNDWSFTPSTGGNKLILKHADLYYCGSGRAVASVANCHWEDVDFYVTHNGTGIYLYLNTGFDVFDDVTIDGTYATSLYLRHSNDSVLHRFWSKATPSLQSLKTRSNKYTILINSRFDKSLMTHQAGVLGFMISINHNLNGEYVVYDPASAGTAYSEIPDDYKPTPNNIFYLQAGTFNCDVGGQVNIIYRLEGAAGTTVNVTAEHGLTMLDPDLSGFLGTLVKTYVIFLGFSAPSRPVPLPMALPVEAYDA